MSQNEEDEERQAWKNVRRGIDTFKEESSLTRGLESESGMSGRVKEVMEVYQEVKSTKSSKKKDNILWEEDEDVRKRLTTKDRKRKISQEPGSLLPKHGDKIINLKTRIKDGDTGMFMRGLIDNGTGGVKELVRKFESFDGQEQDICLQTYKE